MEDRVYQISFFEYLQEVSNYARIDQFAEVIARALRISRSGAYKKIRGISKLTLDEAVVIAKHMDVPVTRFVDQLGTNRNVYLFRSDDVIKPVESYQQWADNILEHSLTLENLRLDYKVTALNNEISMFHLIGFHYLMSFKLFVWDRSTWRIPNHSDQYDYQLFAQDRQLQKTLSQVAEHYRSYESIEVWSIDLLTTTLKQLRHSKRIGAISRADAENVLNDIRKLLAHLMSQAAAGNKKEFGTTNSGAAMQVYLNDTHSNEDLIFIQSDQINMVYVSYLAPNYIRTKDPRVSGYTESWIKNIMIHSSNISGTGVVERTSAQKYIEAVIDRYADTILAD